jgi:SAM-dependent methyltransferase
MSERHRRDWEELAAVDPLWAILSDSQRRGGRWETEEFLATGEPEVAPLLAACEELGLPRGRERVLDFGCGVGRLARPFAARFSEYVGLDVAEGMVEQARRVNEGVPGCTFLAGSLDQLEAASFDLVYSNLVLQHQPSLAVVESSLAGFLRVVRPDGLVVFQLPAKLRLRQRLQPTRRAYAALRRAGLSAELLQRRLRLHPIRLLALPEADTRQVLERNGGRVLRVVAEELGAISSLRYFVAAA